jgi:DNA-directed RNA polymerase specialized sigma24 family protein
MAHHTEMAWPPLESGYTDEFGWIDSEVYRVAGALWPFAENLARLRLHDSAAGQRLLLKAAAHVSRVFVERRQFIRNLRAYLFVTYKRLILEELEASTRRIDVFNSVEPARRIKEEQKAISDDMERKILVQELVQRMDDDMRNIFEFLTLGFTFEEIAERQQTKANILRSRFNRGLKRLIKQIGEENLSLTV